MKKRLYVSSENLTDGSKVWSVVIGNTKLDCISEQDAYELAGKMTKAIEAHTV